MSTTEVEALHALSGSIAQNNDLAPFVAQFLRSRVASYKGFLQLHKLIQKQGQLNLFLPKIKIMDQTKYLDAAYTILKDGQRNAKEILDAIANVRINIEMLRVLEADAKRVQRNYID